MLRRRLILALAPLILMVMAVAVCTILLIESAIEDLSDLGEVVLSRSATSAAITSRLETVEVEAQGIREAPGETGHRTALVAATTALAPEVADHERAVLEHSGEAAHEKLGELYAELAQRTDELIAADSQEERMAAADRVQRSVGAMRHALAAIGQVAEADFRQERDRLATGLRWWTLGLGVTFVVVINISIMVLIRAARMILKPVDELVEASRHLAHEEFEYRVRIDQKDEFGELAVATNAMAEQLHTNEQRKLEVLQQIARTLNHELNNLVSTIDLQLRLLEKRSGSQDAQNEKRLRQIHETLKRMSDTVASLTRIRKVVLTDYVGGIQMVDLQRSIEDDGEAVSASSRPSETSAPVEAKPRT